MISRKSIAKLTLTLSCSLLVSCGTSIRDLTDPGWKQEQKNQELERKLEEDRKTLLGKTAAPFKDYVFDLNSEESACAKASEAAVQFELELKSCTLDKGILDLSVGQIGEIYSQALDSTQDLVGLIAQARDFSDPKLVAFFLRMGLGLYYSKNPA